MDLGVSGLASGFDWRTFVDKMVEVERAPEQRLTSEQNTINNKKIAYGSIKTQLAVLQNRVEALKDPSLFDSRTVQSSDEGAAKITASEGAPLGKYDFTFTQLATAAKLNGSSNTGSALSQSGDVSGVVLSSAGFSRTITAGTFTVNGSQITVDPSQSLQDVFDAIQTATGGTVSASYEPTTDTVSLASAGGELIIGSATDTSNFLNALKLYNNGTSATTSAAALGAVKTSATLASGNFATAIDDGGLGAGLLKINGVEISYSATGDSLNNVIARINDSSAGVIASYDQVNDRVVLTNKTTGDVGISIVDVTGNFAAATGLSSGTLEHGKNLLYSVNGGGTLVSTSNTITEESSGIPSLSVTAQSETSISVTIGSDTDKIKAAIQDLITEYNKTQSLIDTNTASSTDAKGKVTTAALTGEWDATSVASSLRSKVYGAISGFAASMDQLADLGIATNGNDNSISLKDEDALDSALTNNLSGVSKLFTDSSDGIAVKLDEYLTATAGDDGSLVDKDQKLAKDIASIDTQIANMERVILANREAMITSFVKMESAQAQINQQLQFLSQRFGTSSSTPTGASSS
jgi:flagellar hook-associated protein 2